MNTDRENRDTRTAETNLRFGYLAVWMIASLIAAFFALQLDTAAIFDGSYIPVGNDSFYHARRIIDAAVGERGFYQFDSMIHVPEGSWLTWPWGYDYLMATALSLALYINPALEPMAFLAYVPVFWVLINTGLLVAIARQSGLGITMTAIGALAYALLPLNQLLHGIGVIDHHYVELTFVLATVWSGLRFFGIGRAKDAIAIGIVLGIAPAFHNGLFVLQVPVLITVFILWFRGSAPPAKMLYRVAIALIVATLIILIPSHPFRELQFEFWTLSVFHLYVAASTAAILAFAGRFGFSLRHLGLLAFIAAVLASPLLAKALSGAAFLSGDLILLDTITEVTSPFARMRQPGGLEWVTSYYSWLIFLAPILAIAFALRIWQRSDPKQVCFAVFAVFGTALMLTQYRLHPFGSWVLLIGTLLLVQEAMERFEVPVLTATAGSLLLLAIAFQPPLRNTLFYRHPPALTRDYAITHSLFLKLNEVCTERTGAVFSYNDDGHYIRYHTDCSVLTNNFLLTPLHEKKILEANRYLQMSPDEFRLAAPHIDYLFVRMYEIFEHTPQGFKPLPVSEVAARNSPLFVALTFNQDVPKGFRLIDELRVDDERDFAYARIYEVLHDE